MAMGETAEVELRITLDPARFQGIEARIKAPGVTTSEEADLSRDLTAKLESTAFDIKPDGPQRQRARDGRDAIWSWVISPKLEGDHKLLLTIVSNVDEGPSIEPLVRTIHVTAGPGHTADAIREFVLNNWEKLLTVVLIPIGAFAWRSYQKSRRTA